MLKASMCCSASHGPTINTNGSPLRPVHIDDNELKRTSSAYIESCQFFLVPVMRMGIKSEPVL